MTKVVYNACYGGFGLSKKAKEALVERGYTLDQIDNFRYGMRHNKDLVEIVKELGAEADGDYASLEVRTLSDLCTMYRIVEYDGWEEVITTESEGWIYVD